ncbi:MAG: hypothetical protein KDD44_00850 [Bdellovibrionales bacterium]|nr:hypothetical protein [Bdellovibrionales bacterium]
MEERDEGLERLKARMTSQQRKDMAELLANELKARREAKEQALRRKKSKVSASKFAGELDRSQIREVYQEMHRRMQEKKGPQSKGLFGRAAKKRTAPPSTTALAQSLNPEAVSDEVTLSTQALRGPVLVSKNMLLVGGVVFFAVL